MPVGTMSTNTPAQQQPTLLIVAPNPDIVNLVKAVLANVSNRMLVANDAEEAFAQAKKDQPDVILATCGLDEVGSSLCLKVRQDPQLSQTPFIMLTSSSEQRIYASYFAKGCDQIVPFPFKCSDLHHAIVNACKRNQEGIESKIHVLFRSGLADYVEPARLNQLLSRRELICFRRRDGLAMVGQDPLRCMVRSDYSGPERRYVGNQAG